MASTESNVTRPAGPADLALPLALVHDLLHTAAHPTDGARGDSAPGSAGAGRRGARRRSAGVRG
nr:hypothetical protein OH820_14745 [Streptomyces sp. NBC_00857]